MNMLQSLATAKTIVPRVVTRPTNVHIKLSSQCLQRGLYSSNLVTVTRQRRSFHQTAAAFAPVGRRRRRRDAPLVAPESDEEDEDGENEGKGYSTYHSAAVTDAAVFAQEADALLKKIQAALEPLRKFNSPFALSRGHEEDVEDFLLLNVVTHQYTIQVDTEQCIVVMVSPISGQRAYILCANTGTWRGTEDGHALEGLLVRDLIRHVQGVPKL